MLYPLVNVYITNWKDPPFLMGKSTISMVIFNSYVKLPEGSFGTKEAIAELEMEMLGKPEGGCLLLYPIPIEVIRLAKFSTFTVVGTP